MSINPYAAGSVYDPDDNPRPDLPDLPPTDRLARLGASEDLLDTVRQRWAALTSGERVVATEAVDALTDNELLAEIANDEAGLLADLTEDAKAVLTSKAAVAAEWIGLSVVRAQAALTVERGRTKPRAAIIEYCERLLAGLDPTL